MLSQESALRFACQGEQLLAIVHRPPAAAARGVLIVVGGPQYRVGSHRQFLLLARSLAEQGTPVMRFDYRGMGDSSGAARDFSAVDDDLRAALDQFMAAVPGLAEVVIWGLCDGASAALFYAGQDPRVTGLVLVNPWARTAAGLAQATLKHYDLGRLADPALWRKMLRLQFDYRAAAASLLRLVGAAARPAPAGQTPALPQRLQAGLQTFAGPVLLVVCEADLTGQEFLALGASSPDWRALLAAPRVTHRRQAEADHTFSRRVWHEQLVDWTATWLRTW